MKTEDYEALHHLKPVLQIEAAGEHMTKEKTDIWFPGRPFRFILNVLFRLHIEKKIFIPAHVFRFLKTE